MKKMIVIAALIGGMLMPAQIMANNNNDRRPKVERRGNGNEIRVSKDKRGGKKDNYRDDRRGYDRPGKPGKPDYRPDYRPGRPAPVVVVNPPAPRPCPPPPPRYYYNDYYYDNPVVDAAAAFISIVGLMSIIAD